MYQIQGSRVQLPQAIDANTSNYSGQRRPELFRLQLSMDLNPLYENNPDFLAKRFSYECRADVVDS